MSFGILETDAARTSFLRLRSSCLPTLLRVEALLLLLYYLYLEGQSACFRERRINRAPQDTLSGQVWHILGPHVLGDSLMERQKLPIPVRKGKKEGGIKIKRKERKRFSLSPQGKTGDVL